MKYVFSGKHRDWLEMKVREMQLASDAKMWPPEYMENNAPESSVFVVEIGPVVAPPEPVDYR